MALAIVSSGLSVACLISALQNKLDLFHAFCVIHLLILAIPSTRDDDAPNQPVDGEGSTWTSCGRALLRLPSAVNLIGLFILFNDVFADPTSYGATAECNSQVRLSVLGAAIHSTSGVIPWLASILVLFATIYTLVILYQQVNWFALMIKAEREAFRSLSRRFRKRAAKALKSLRRFYDPQAADVPASTRFFYNGRSLRVADFLPQPAEALPSPSSSYNPQSATEAVEGRSLVFALAEACIFKYAAAFLLRLYVILTVESMFGLNHVDKATVSHTTTSQIILLVLAVLVFLWYLKPPEGWRSREEPFILELKYAYPKCKPRNPRKATR